MAYDETEDLLFVVYTDNNIDVISEEGILNFPFIKNNTSIIGSKQVNDLYISGGFTYLSTDFGLLAFNNQKLEFSSTTFTEVKINAAAVRNNVLYAATDKGLYRVKLDKEVNIADFGQWVLTPVSNLNPIGAIEEVAVRFNQVFVRTVRDMYKTVGQSDAFELAFRAQPSETINYISDEGPTLMFGVEDNKNQSITRFYEENGNIIFGGASCTNRTLYAVEDQKGRVWYADRWDPIRYTTSRTEGCKNLRYSGPFENSAGEIDFKDDKVYFASLGITEDYQYANTNRGFYAYEDQKWTNYNQDNIQDIRNFDFQNVQGMAVHPKNSEILLGSYWNGVLQYNLDTKTVKHWNKNNSTLQGIVGDEARTRVPFLIFDDKQNLWVSNFGAPKPLAVKTPDDKWFSFSVPGNTNLADIAIDDAGNKWIAVVGTGNGLLVHNHGNDVTSASDDKARYLSKNNSSLAGNKVNCVAVDLDGVVWVGTDAGPVFFDCGDPFKAECKGAQTRVIVDNIPAPLLKGEDILSIEIDGANRKWFGTRNGIFVQSPDATDEIALYNTSNSPLMDNKVINLSYNGETGEMFIVTPAGIQTVKTETSSPEKNHNESNIYAYPNPVRPEYIGPIAIKGLVRDANVKITDVNGRLVYETTALGGQAIWDGNDYNGVKAAAGVYLVFSANDDLSSDIDNFVTKIMIIR
jgi:ligand-binding sensor domain-containing protein